jgi:hypothetical protein
VEYQATFFSNALILSLKAGPSVPGHPFCFTSLSITRTLLKIFNSGKLKTESLKLTAKKERRIWYG